MILYKNQRTSDHLFRKFRCGSVMASNLWKHNSGQLLCDLHLATPMADDGERMNVVILSAGCRRVDEDSIEVVDETLKSKPQLLHVSLRKGVYDKPKLIKLPGIPLRKYLEMSTPELLTQDCLVADLLVQIRKGGDGRCP